MNEDLIPRITRLIEASYPPSQSQVDADALATDIAVAVASAIGPTPHRACVKEALRTGTVDSRENTLRLHDQVCDLASENERLRAALEEARPTSQSDASMEAWCRWWVLVAQPALAVAFELADEVDPPDR